MRVEVFKLLWCSIQSLSTAQENIAFQHIFYQGLQSVQFHEFGQRATYHRSRKYCNSMNFKNISNLLTS